ncbi:MAG TPA: protease inhibitor I42 family protein, partial [Mucilaginibacter sp.]
MKFFALVFFCVFCHFAHGQTPPTDSLTVKLGHTFTVRLDSQPSTGYSWLLTDSLDKKQIRQIKVPYMISPKKGLPPGAAGKQVFTFKAIKQGADTIHLAYVRPWQKGIPRDAK